MHEVVDRDYRIAKLNRDGLSERPWGIDPDAALTCRDSDVDIAEIGGETERDIKRRCFEIDGAAKQICRVHHQFNVVRLQREPRYADEPCKVGAADCTDPCAAGGRTDDERRGSLDVIDAHTRAGDASKDVDVLECESDVEHVGKRAVAKCERFEFEPQIEVFFDLQNLEQVYRKAAAELEQRSEVGPIRIDEINL